MENTTIGKLAKLTGVNTETIRYYERRGLMPRPPSSDSGYRLYGKKDISRLIFIRRCLRLGLILDEIHELLNAHLDDVHKRKLDSASEALAARRADLEQLYNVIQEMISENRNSEQDIIDRLMHSQRWQERPKSAV